MRKTGYLIISALFLIAIAAMPALTTNVDSATASPTTGTNQAEPLVTAWFAVRGANGQPNATLTKQDFRLYEDGQAHPIVSVVDGASEPLTLGFLFQFSGRRRNTLPYREIDPTSKFLQSVWHGKSEGFAATFASNVHSLGGLTDNLAKLEDDIHRAKGDELEGGSSLYDAIVWACEKRLAMRPGTQKVLVIVGDGHDNYSDHKFQDAVTAALRAGAEVYFVDLVHANSYYSARPRKEAELVRAATTIAGDTGGDVVFVRRKKDFQAAFDRIAEQLRRQYAVRFRLAGKDCDGKFHRIEIRGARSGLRVIAPGWFYAPKACGG